MAEGVMDREGREEDSIRKGLGSESITVPPSDRRKPRFDRFFVMKWYNRALWVLLAFLIYGTIVIYIMAQALLGVNHQLSIACKPEITPQSVPFSTVVFAMDPRNWGAPLDSLMNASYANQIDAISKGCPAKVALNIPLGSWNAP